MSTFGDRLREARKRKKLTQQGLAELIDVKHNSISNWENGQNVPDPDTIERICSALNVSFNYLFGQREVSLFDLPDILAISKEQLPVIGVVSCGEPTFAEEQFEYYVNSGTRINADFILRAKGDSMIGARIYEGDLVFVRQQPDVEDGQIAVVLIDDDTLLKRVYKLSDGRRELRAENPKYKPIMVGGKEETRTIKILGLAVALQTDVV